MHGLILGTPSYMSPEQARGQRVDKRGDIWSFGCVLYEMLTGRLAFPGDTVSDTIAEILERDPDWSALPAATPEAVRRVLLRCLAKKPQQRLRDIGDVRIEIDALDEVLPADFRNGRPRSWASSPRRIPLPWVVAAVLAAGLACGSGRPDDRRTRESAGQRAVHAVYELGGQRGRGRDFARRRGSWRSSRTRKVSSNLG